MASTVWRSGDQTTIVALLDRRLEADPHGEYLDVVGDKVSAADIRRTSASIANALADMGVGHGDRVATLIENSIEGAQVWWGIIHRGAISVPINTAYKGEYLRHQLADSGSKVVVVEADLLDRVTAIIDALDAVTHVVVIDGEAPELPGRVSFTWADLLSADDTHRPVDISPADLGTFIYTGGTTGPSKGCMLSHNYHEALATQIGISWQRTADDVVWTPLPLFHFNAVSVALVGSLVSGGRSAIYRRFSVSNFWLEMNRTGATITSTLGTMAYLLAHDEDRPEMPRSGAPEANSSLRLMGAAPLPPEVDDILRSRFGIDTFSAAYGVTEASLISWQPPGGRNTPTAAGVNNSDYFDVRIIDDDDTEVARGARGEIVIRPKRPEVMFAGYWGRPEATVASSRNWWYHTG
ncbi:MAG: AMP-binding protein, partial [Acidimicrobiia bacterium]